jgi:hypothetical protein
MSRFWLVVTIVAALAIGAFELVPRTLKVRISEEQASAKMQEALDKKAHEGLAVERAVLTFNNNAVQFSGHVAGVRFGQQFSADVSVDGVPRYDERQQAIYFSPTTFTLKNFAFKGETPSEKARRFGGTIFKNTTVGTVLENSAESIERWVTQTAENRVRLILEKRPVYRIKDDVKGMLIKASLTTISIEENHAVATLSIVKFSLKIALLIVSFIAGAVLVFVILIS